MVNWNIILTVIIITIILIILILLTLNYFNKIENFNTVSSKYGYICTYNSNNCTQADKTLCITEGYSLYACGDNEYEKLGFSNDIAAITYIPVAKELEIYKADGSKNKISEIYNYDTDTILVTEDGYAYGYGTNYNGRLSFGDTLNRNRPTAINRVLETANTYLSNIKQVSAASNHTIILTDYGDVYSTGLNDYGQLGLYGLKSIGGDESHFRQLPLSNVNKISCGEDNSYFLMNNGEVWACGRNNYGQLGLDHTTDVDRPTKIPNLSNIIDISAKYDSCLFLKEDDSGVKQVWACGRNNYGQLGFAGGDQPLPTENTTLSYIVKIFMGYKCSFYIDKFGYYHACGRNHYGQLGLGNKTDRPQADKNLYEDDIIDISCGKHFNMFLKSDGYVYSCGRHGNGRLGVDGLTADKQDLTIINFGNTFITAIYCGDNHTLFKDNVNNVYVCGTGNNGQIGLGDTAVETTPTTIDTIDNVDIINCGTDNSFILKNTGELYSFGRNDQGQLGFGDQTNRDEPFEIDTFHANDEFNNISKIAIGSDKSYFVMRDGTVYITGDNYLPLLLPIPKKIKDVFILRESFYFLTEDNEVYCYGYNFNYQLGLGDRVDRTVPTLIETDSMGNKFNNIKRIEGGTRAHAGYESIYTTMFLKNDGTVYFVNNEVHMPTHYPFMINIKDICIGTSHNLFLTNDGNVYMTGDNIKTSSAKEYEKNPIKLSMVNIIAISCSAEHALFLSKYGDVYCDGLNNHGQLGVGDRIDRHVPTHIPYLRNVKKIYTGRSSNTSYMLSNAPPAGECAEGADYSVKYVPAVNNLACANKYDTNYISVPGGNLTLEEALIMCKNNEECGGIMRHRSYPNEGKHPNYYQPHPSTGTFGDDAHCAGSVTNSSYNMWTGVPARFEVELCPGAT